MDEKCELVTVTQAGRAVIGSITMWINQHDGVWDGFFDAAAGQEISVGGPYHLRTGDGREGDFNVTNIHAHGDTKTVYLEGAGPLLRQAA